MLSPLKAGSPPPGRSLPGAPRRAVVLAAGYGARMAPWSLVRPKPLLPFWGRTLLDRTLDLLASWGVRDALVNLHHRPEALLDHLRARPAALPRLTLSYEPVLLGTGGALRRAAWFPDGKPFWLINADIVADLDPRPLLKAFRRSPALAALWMEPRKGPRTVRLERGEVVSFRDPRPGSPGTWTFTGLHLLSPRILEYLPQEERFGGIVEAYERARAAGEHLRGVAVPGAFWADVGDPESLVAAHAERICPVPQGNLVSRSALLSRGVRVRGFAAVERGARVARGARLENTIAVSGSLIGPRARLRNAIVTEGARAGAGGGRLLVRARAVLEEAERDALAAVGWDPERATLDALPPRGSARTFWRLRSGGASLMLIRYSLERPENGLVAAHARLLADAGVPVPGVLHHDPDRCFLLMQDAGEQSLTDLADGPPARRAAGYRHALRAMLTLHEQGAALVRRRRPRLMPAFGPAVYRWEHELFITHYLPAREDAPASTPGALLRDLRQVARGLAGIRPALVHRDFQSGNVIGKGRRWFLIDFQGMRMGPRAYDLASLLCDPYAKLAPREQESLLGYYLARTPYPEEIRRTYRAAAIQRLVQALGAFGRLSALPGLAHYRAYVPPAEAMLRRILGEGSDLPALRAWCAGKGAVLTSG